MYMNVYNSLRESICIIAFHQRNFCQACAPRDSSSTKGNRSWDPCACCWTELPRCAECHGSLGEGWLLEYVLGYLIWVFPKIGGKPPKSSHLFIGLSIIFTIPFWGVNTPIFGSTRLGAVVDAKCYRQLDQLSGLYPGDPGPPGADSAGTVLSTGSEITHIRSLECWMNGVWICGFV